MTDVVKVCAAFVFLLFSIVHYPFGINWILKSVGMHSIPVVLVAIAIGLSLSASKSNRPFVAHSSIACLVLALMYVAHLVYEFIHLIRAEY